ncbi:MAG TPA: macro domain-containing protein [Anaerolineales bacterium]|nr:macro domain-containing protein [Anaerolineales bacterium]
MDNKKYAGKKCFVIMPFGKKDVVGNEGKTEKVDFDKIYSDLIKKAVDELGIECERCDEIVDNGPIVKKMFRGIFDADVAVVDITSLNPNVFYELGVRHALQKFVTVIICKNGGQSTPFNIRGINILFYDTKNEEQLEEARKSIREHIRKGLDTHSTDSIVHDALNDILKVERKYRTLSKQEIFSYPLVNLKDKEIGVITGDLKKVKNIDVWVNSENTNMQMARHLERSISASIRYYGAKKDSAGRVEEDIVAAELYEKVGFGEAPAGVVIPTSSGELKRTHKVKKIFHAAAVMGQVGEGYKPIPDIAECIYNSLVLMDSDEMKSENLHTILFPLMGTGTTRLEAEGIADKLIGTAISYLEENPDSKVQKVYFLAFNESDIELCKHIIESEKRLIHEEVIPTPKKLMETNKVKTTATKKKVVRKKK